MPSEPTEPIAALPSPSSLATALAVHARRHPHRPFLFWPEGLDWRWASFAEVAADVERLRAGSRARLEETSAAPAAVVAALREIVGPPPADTPAFRQMPELAAAAVGSGAVLARGAPAHPRREVVVVTPPFADEGEGLFFARAVVDGAAVVVEPSRCALVATAAWARPTIFRGTPAEVVALSGEAEAAERAGFAGWWRRVRRLLGADPPPPLPFDRLHTLLVTGPPPAEDDLAFWRQRGTRVLADPAGAGRGAE